jgi:hypothetical protein
VRFSALLPSSQIIFPFFFFIFFWRTSGSFFVIFSSVTPHRGQPAVKCHPKWQPTRRCCSQLQICSFADNFSCYVPQHSKIICVVEYNMEKWSALLATTRKNVRIRLFPRIRNHMQIYTRVSIRGLG